VSKLKLIVGLGNPGAEYDRTRHNAGADWIDELARHFGAPLNFEQRYFGNVARINIGGQDVRLLVPTTFMNRSGQSVAAICKFFKIIPEEILVAHDELDLAPGICKLKVGGGHGGHNGLRDIISALGNSKNFTRLRIGIGHPGNSKLVANYVLKRASQDDQVAIESSCDRATQVITEIANGDIQSAMLKLHSAN